VRLIRRIPLVLLLAIAAHRPVAQGEQRHPQSIVIHAKQFAFSPGSITLKKGETVKLVLISDDVPHGLTVEGLGIQAEISPGKPTEVVVTPAAAGDFPGSCFVFCGASHRDMEFMVHVVE
jgi:cytochrome c oxidase subunit II